MYYKPGLTAIYIKTLGSKVQITDYKGEYSESVFYKGYTDQG